MKCDVVIGNGVGAVQYGAVKSIKGSFSVLEDAILAFAYGVRLAVDLGCQHLIFESDSSQEIAEPRKRFCVLIVFGAVVHEVLSMVV